MLRVAIVVGSTRPGRLGKAVADWVLQHSRSRTDAEFELVDLADQGLPLLDEPIPPSQGRYSQPHTKRWAELVAGFDAYVFVTPEYNHATSGALKNALDFLYKEWNDKAAGLVGYGAMSGARAVENLRLILAELQVATVRQQVGFSLFTDWEGFKDFRPQDHHQQALGTMLDQLVAWGTALRGVREGHAHPPRPPRPGPGGGRATPDRPAEPRERAAA